MYEDAPVHRRRRPRDALSPQPPKKTRPIPPEKQTRHQAVANGVKSRDRREPSVARYTEQKVHGEAGHDRPETVSTAVQSCECWRWGLPDARAVQPVWQPRVLASASTPGWLDEEDFVRRVN